MPFFPRTVFSRTPISRLVILLTGFSLCLSCSSRKQDPYSGWRTTAGTREGIRYSSLTQVDTSNVTRLQVAWVYHTGDADTLNHSQIQCTPVVADGVMFVTSPRLLLFAVDAATGKEKWSFDPQDAGRSKTRFDFIMNNNRGSPTGKMATTKRAFFIPRVPTFTRWMRVRARASHPSAPEAGSICMKVWEGTCMISMSLPLLPASSTRICSSWAPGYPNRAMRRPAISVPMMPGRDSSDGYSTPSLNPGKKVFPVGKTRRPGNISAAPIPGRVSAWMRKEVSCSLLRAVPPSISTVDGAKGRICSAIACWPLTRPRVKGSGISRRFTMIPGIRISPRRPPW